MEPKKQDKGVPSVKDILREVQAIIRKSREQAVLKLLEKPYVPAKASS